MTGSRPRNLDLATLRSFVTIAELGSMTRAAGRLHMTQSAISMQIKRLEDSLGLNVFERSPQGMSTTSEGDQLLQFANRMLVLNDEAIGRLTSPQFEGEVRLAAPSDIVHPHIPLVLKQFRRDFPRVQVQLSTGFSVNLLREFDQGQQDVVMTTERQPGKNALTLVKRQLTWTGAIGGHAWKQRPLPIGLSKNCIFRAAVTGALEQAGIDWVDQVVSDDDLVIHAMVAADQCVHADFFSQGLTDREPIDHGAQLPQLPEHVIALYYDQGSGGPIVESLVDYLQQAYA